MTFDHKLEVNECDDVQDTDNNIELKNEREEIMDEESTEEVVTAWVTKSFEEKKSTEDLIVQSENIDEVDDGVNADVDVKYDEDVKVGDYVKVNDDLKVDDNVKDDDDMKADGYMKADDVKVNDDKIEYDLKVNDKTFASYCISL